MRATTVAPAALAALVTGLLLGGALDPLIDGAHAALSGGNGSLPAPTGRVAAVVVLGYALDRHGRPSPALAARVADGLAAWRIVADDGAALVFSGGAPTRARAERAPLSEAAIMAAAAAEMTTGGAKLTAWLLEETSTSTWENALFSVRLLKERGALTPASTPPLLLIATSPFHGARSLATFRSVLARAGGGAVAALAPAHRPPPASAVQRAERVVEAAREIAALAYYAARGRLC